MEWEGGTDIVRRGSTHNACTYRWAGRISGGTTGDQGVMLKNINKGIYRG